MTSIINVIIILSLFVIVIRSLSLLLGGKSCDKLFFCSLPIVELWQNKVGVTVSFGFLQHCPSFVDIPSWIGVDRICPRCHHEWKPSRPSSLLSCVQLFYFDDVSKWAASYQILKQKATVMSHGSKSTCSPPLLLLILSPFPCIPVSAGDYRNATDENHWEGFCGSPIFSSSLPIGISEGKLKETVSLTLQSWATCWISLPLAGMISV